MEGAFLKRACEVAVSTEGSTTYEVVERGYLTM